MEIDPVIFLLIFLKDPTVNFCTSCSIFRKRYVETAVSISTLFLASTLLLTDVETCTFIDMYVRILVTQVLAEWVCQFVTSCFSDYGFDYLFNNV